MANVFIGRDLNNNRIFAIKVLKPEIALQDDLLKRFQREAGILATLTNPHIVRVVEYGEDENTYFLVMEYVDGSTLKQCMVASGAFTSERALELGVQIAKG